MSTNLSAKILEIPNRFAAHRFDVHSCVRHLLRSGTLTDSMILEEVCYEDNYVRKAEIVCQAMKRLIDAASDGIQAENYVFTWISCLEETGSRQVAEYLRQLLVENRLTISSSERQESSAGSWPVELSREYEKLHKLGEGQSGKVYLARSKTDNELVAIKKIDMAKLGFPFGTSSSLSRQKLETLFTLKHRNIANFRRRPLERLVDNGRKKIRFLYILMDYCDGGTLAERIHLYSSERRTFVEEQIVNWTKQICSAIKFLHDCNVLHGDLQTENIMLCGKGDLLKLTDINFTLNDPNLVQNLAFTSSRSVLHLSPEMANTSRNRYAAEDDIWSIGIILYQLMTLKLPFAVNYHHDSALILVEIINKIKTHQFEPFDREMYSAGLNELLDRLLDRDARKRPSIDEILVEILKIRLIGPLMQAAQIGDTDTVGQIFREAKEIVGHDGAVAILESPDPADMNFGNSALHYAVKHGQVDLIRKLKAFGVRMTLPNKAGNQPLSIAVIYNQKNIIEELYKADIFHRSEMLNGANAGGRRPIHFAMKHGYQEIVELLLQRGASIDVCDDEGNTAMHYAAWHNHPEAALAFLKFDEVATKSLVNRANKRRSTPLHQAIRRGHSAIAHFLLERGADMTLRDDEGKTPKDYFRPTRLDANGAFGWSRSDDDKVEHDMEEFSTLLSMIDVKSVAGTAQSPIDTGNS